MKLFAAFLYWDATLVKLVLATLGAIPACVFIDLRFDAGMLSYLGAWVMASGLVWLIVTRGDFYAEKDMRLKDFEERQEGGK